MIEKLEKQEEVELCENCKYEYTQADLRKGDGFPCPECGNWDKLYGTKITTSKIYIQ